MYCSDLAIASGIGGGVGKCAPSARKPMNEMNRVASSISKGGKINRIYEPFSSAMYVTVIGVPSGDVYEYEPKR